MKKLILKRTQTDHEGTFGGIYDESGIFVCHTGELPNGGTSKLNERSVDYIPTGEYKCTWVLSPRFKKYFYRLQDVPNRDGVLIHKGNFCGDKARGFKSDVEGCILVGRKLGSKDGQKAILYSTDAYEKDFLPLVNEQPFMLKIEEHF